MKVMTLAAAALAALPAIPAYAQDTASRNLAAPCAICLSAHAKAPTITVQFLPLIYAVETVAVAYKSEGKSTAPELSLFIRPPPSV